VKVGTAAIVHANVSSKHSFVSALIPVLQSAARNDDDGDRPRKATRADDSGTHLLVVPLLALVAPPLPLPPRHPAELARGSQELHANDSAARRTCTDAREKSVL
jgi:hypothetical protein